jgi:predicted DNA-binding protein (MmcQ/YjbR family)
VRAKLREFALSLPEATEDLPWGERVAKVKKKVFVFLGRDMDAHFGLGVKLPSSNQRALALPFTEPTGYGLGKSGWVSAKFEVDASPSFELLRDWVVESYCAVAPKALAARLRGHDVSDVSDATAKPKAKRASKAKAPVSAKRVAKAAAKSRSDSKSVRRKPVKRATKRQIGAGSGSR